MVAITVVSVIVWISSALSKAIRLRDVGDGWRALLLGAPPGLL